MPTDESRRKIDQWIAEAPDNRVVETTRLAGQWQTQALEDGDVVYEETDVGDEDPLLELLAAWCERQSQKVAARPPVKAGGELGKRKVSRG